jgi:hypothetical protein
MGRGGGEMSLLQVEISCFGLNFLFEAIMKKGLIFAVLRIRIRDPVLFGPLDPGSRSGIRDGKIQIQDPRSGMNTPDL